MKINKYAFLITAIIAVVAIAASMLFFSGINTASAQSSPELTQFTALSRATTDQCAYLGNQAAIYKSINSMPNDMYFQGSCCSPMVYNHYKEQIAGLKNYSNISAIPQNPYNVSLGQVKQMLGYYTNITLNQSQNVTFNQAASLTQDKSWCCCQCWAWYAHAGLAKYMIKNYNYNVSQVVTLINLEDCCGG
jgi:hypothetical protein